MVNKPFNKILDSSSNTSLVLPTFGLLKQVYFQLNFEGYGSMNWMPSLRNGENICDYWKERVERCLCVASWDNTGYVIKKQKDYLDTS